MLLQLPQRRDRTASINWLRIAELTGEQGNDGIFARQELLRAKARIQAMSPAELLAALANVKTLDLDLRSRREVDGLLLNALGEKDPEAAMTYVSAPENLQMGLPKNILAAWAKSDLPAALAWFDGQIAKGTFDSKSLDGKTYRRSTIEAALLANLLTSDPDAALRRLSAYPQADRSYIFQEISIYNSRNENDLAARVVLARETLSAREQASVISKSIAFFSEAGDYAKIDGFLDRISATPEERDLSLSATGTNRLASLYSEGKLTTGEIDNFREWAASHSPTTVDRLTGATLSRLADSSGSGDSNLRAKAEELLTYYQETLGNDDVLLGFIEAGRMWRDPGKTRALAEKIKDPARREQFLESLKPGPANP